MKPGPGGTFTGIVAAVLIPIVCAAGAIIAAIVRGARGAAVTTDADRQVAIYRVLSEAQPGDVVLLAGKGHETWQEINGVRHPFSDAEVALAALEARTA